MGTRYRIVVEQIDDDEDTRHGTRETVLFEVLSPSATRLLTFAPGEVAVALEAASVEAPVEASAEAVPTTIAEDVAPAAKRARRKAPVDVVAADKAREEAEREGAEREGARVVVPEPAVTENPFVDTRVPVMAPAAAWTPF